ncbi:MAG: cohesin domain-containing protein [Patescibacteria group bacterium]
MNKTIVILASAALFFGASVLHAHAATLRLTPATGSFILGSTFDVSVILNTQNEPVNTLEVELEFPPDKLQIANPSLGKSIVQIWASPPTFSNQEGRIYFVGGIPSPGINTSEGVVQSFTFRVVAPGEAFIKFGNNNSILSNDGFGTDVLKQKSPASFKLILPPQQGPDVFSPTHPEEGKWYKDINPILKWTSVSQTQGFSYSLDHDPNGAPDTEIDSFEAEASFSDLTSGIWYFHVREKAGGSWGGVSHYSLSIDADPPAVFGVDISPGSRTSSRSPIIRFFTTDSLSGFDHFEVKLVSLKSGPTDSTFFFEASSPYQFSALRSGRYELIVRAYDAAGNFRDESETVNIVSSIFQFMSPEGIDLVFFFVPWGLASPLLVFLAIFFAGVGLVYWRKNHPHIKEVLRQSGKKIRVKPAIRKL